jgi:hypothetical protein
MPIDVHSYLIDPSGKDWAALLSHWSELLPETLSVWLVNRFGDAFTIFEDGSIHLLDVGAGTIRRVADNRDHFAAESEVADNANNWLMIPLVDQAVGSGMALGSDQCYAFKIPPMLGDEYALQNVAVLGIAEYYAFLSDVAGQIKGISDGTNVNIHVAPRPT